MRRIDLAWGTSGLAHAAPFHTVVVVDVLSFCSAVDAACSTGARVFPFAWNDGRAQQQAAAVGARLAVARQDAAPDVPSLSPPSLLTLSPGERLLLPSPNGSTLAAMARAPLVVAGCLRNAAAVAGYVDATPGPVLVVAAGERWPDGSLRPALEDYLGAGAIIARLTGQKSPDARAAQAVFADVANLDSCLRALPSGIELIERGFGADVTFAAQLDVIAVRARACERQLRGSCAGVTFVQDAARSRGDTGRSVQPLEA